MFWKCSRSSCWESFIIRLDILIQSLQAAAVVLRIFHYSPWYTYTAAPCSPGTVENLSLFALIYLRRAPRCLKARWESFIIRLDILTATDWAFTAELRIFHYSPWYTYTTPPGVLSSVENLSLFALIYLRNEAAEREGCWESFIIRLDILSWPGSASESVLRIFHYSPWYT